MAKWLAAAALAWPFVLGGAVWLQATGRASAWTTAVYAAASRVCHQRPDRSFHTAGIQWPVCGRCSGLYAGGAVGGLLAARRLRRRVARHPALRVLLVAALPTMITLAIEWSGSWPVSNVVRAVAATSLGAAVVLVIARVAAEGRPEAIG